MPTYKYFIFLHVILANRNVYKSFVRIIFGLNFLYFNVIVMFIQSIKLQLFIVIIQMLRLFVCIFFCMHSDCYLYKIIIYFIWNVFAFFCQLVFKCCLLMSCFCWFLSIRSFDIRVPQRINFETYIVSHRCYGNAAKVIN